MSKQDSPKDVIASYRKKQHRSQRTPVLVLVLAALFLVIGFGVLIFWLTGAEPPSLNVAGLLASETPTPTDTPTATPVPPTATPTLTPTLEPPTNTPEPSATPTMSGPFIYVVEEGDTFFSIAERFGVDILVLIEVNRERMNLDPNNPILRVGDEVLVPPAGAQLPTPTALPQDLPPGTRIQYTIQPGDTLGGIALKFNSTVEDILKRNEALADDPNAIFVGQVIEVRVNLVTPAPTTAATQAPQSTPGSIATLTPTATP